MHAGDRAVKRLSLHVGFQLRYAPPLVELVRRTQTGAIGDISAAETFYHTRAINRPDWPEAANDERRVRNWVWDRVLSGDILVEQAIHVVDICNWMLDAHPVKAIGTGGRAPRSDAGDAWSHYDVTLTYPNDIHVSLFHTQFLKGWNDVGQRFFGTKGVSEAHYSGPVRTLGDDPWEWKPEGEIPADGKPPAAIQRADPEKHMAFINSIINHKFDNQAAQGAESALSAMLGREAAYAGHEITWDKLLKSHENWDARIDFTRL